MKEMWRSLKYAWDNGYGWFLLFVSSGLIAVPLRIWVFGG